MKDQLLQLEPPRTNQEGKLKVEKRKKAEKGKQNTPKNKKALKQPIVSNTKETKQKVQEITAPKETIIPTEIWAEVTKKGEKKKETAIFENGKGKNDKNTSPIPFQEKKKKNKPSKTVAVVITCQDEVYEQKLREARSKVNLADLSIETLKVRSGIIGGYIFEVAGENKTAKADQRQNFGRR